MSRRGDETWGPYPLVLAGAVIGVGVAGFGYPMPGAILIAVSLLLAAALRLLRGDRAAGRLAVRGRGYDAATTAVLGGMIVVTVLFLMFYRR
ncbi:Protein of unknown function [Sinosporangium album]|uniref:DUF3017 domain-containing protein n=1 Tax=Sinosporangium album TaxID=504805 RepID=A0A1G8CVY7_9ACTN|nr:DUF3017 domain-containing protein [Sinosporangium album]SDH49636.1 Protein of unknown function [Sinosporangium album]